MTSRYRTIVADPPWPIKDTGPRTAPRNGNWERGAGTTGRRSVVPYRRLPITAIRDLPIGGLADESAHLYLWTINAFLPDAYEVARAWGFKPSTLLTWCKKPMGLGFGGAFVPTTEFVLFCRRGVLAHKTRIDSTWFEWSRSYIGDGGPTHSAKPDPFLRMVEEVSPGPYLELFARRARPGWDCWGDEAPNPIKWAA